MLKLLIVDDEQIEREGMAAILRNSFPDTLIEQAKNGKAAVELVPVYEPDLILMDIRMPIMNGLEAVELIAADYPDIRFIMVTAYDTFEYARRAIKLGVKDYLLKPSKIGEIRETVGSVMEQIRIEQKERNERLNERNTLDKVMPLVEADVVTQLLFDRVHEVHLDELLNLIGGKCGTEAFVLLIRSSAGDASASEEIYSAVKLKLRQIGNGWVGAMSGRCLPIIGFVEENRSYRAQAASMIRELLALPQLASQPEIVIGVGDPRSSLDHTRHSYQEALLAAAAAPATPFPSKHRFYADLQNSSDQESGWQQGKRQEKQMTELIRLGRWEEAGSLIESAISRYEAGGMPVHMAQQRMLEALWIVFRIMLELGAETELPYYTFEIHHYAELRTETECLLFTMRKASERQRSRQQTDVIAEVKQYIMANSHLEISLETIARQAGLSPFYMSKMFKEQTGVGYIDFLTDCRVEKSKALMSNAERSMKEIAYEVGYNDPNYFSKVFKKVCGASPTDYRKALLGGGGK
ncbi:response regulator [Paenibacillus sp. NEAU-GSW1]|uniref:response regulator n=1 Tax=Paenibacillus sp. NEAU-GSW1 TaxID=2682486 RepID=UPI0012E2E880|nr:response regulator [Paenibacillus sp. NEAU-GSW1]MUT68766.1 response regulator [Paenibacillus sp. NEAU-GSW1]